MDSGDRRQRGRECARQPVLHKTVGPGFSKLPRIHFKHGELNNTYLLNKHIVVPACQALFQHL